MNHHICIFTDEASVGMIYSKKRNVGKSLTAQIMAKGQGVCTKNHPILLSGGDQTLCGTSL